MSRSAWPPPSSRFELLTPDRTWVLSSGDSAADKGMWLEAIGATVGLDHAGGDDADLFVGDDVGGGDDDDFEGDYDAGHQKKVGWLCARECVTVARRCLALRRAVLWL